MSKVKIQGNATGTGIFTVAAPATNTDRILTLPDVNATVLTTAGGTISGPVVINSGGNDQFRLTDGTQSFYIDTDSSGVALSGGAGQTGPGVYLYNSEGSVNLFTNNALRLKVDSSGRMTNQYQPAFRFRKTTSFSINGSDFPVFDQIDYNRGGYYSTSTGRFTAPVTGVYTFYAHVQPTTTGVASNINFRVNGNTLTYSQNGWTSLPSRGDISVKADLLLNANDYVDVIVSTSSSVLFDNHGIFSGYLVG